VILPPAAYIRPVTGTVAHRYLRLGLQLNRHVDGTVDADFGPPELAAEVEAAPPVAPPTLVADAEALLGELDDGWLRDQGVGPRTYIGVLAGESLSYGDEVHGCYGVRPRFTDESVYAAAHERLEDLLPAWARWPSGTKAGASRCSYPSR
jgi:hypothetical protein